MHAYVHIGSLKEGDKILFWGGTQWWFSSIGSWGLTSLVLFYFVLPHRHGLEELEEKTS